MDDGGRGNDVLQGGEGNDTIYGGDHDGGGGDYIYGGAGNDSISIGGSYGSYVYGEEGNDYFDLSRGTGSSWVYGGVGNDTYYVTNRYNAIVENAGEGTDLVQSSITLTLAANVEKLTLTGTTAINGTGNALNNTLTGNSADNILDGGAGTDTLVGGLGNDTYYVSTGDTVTESTSAGTDTVISDATWTLAATSRISPSPARQRSTAPATRWLTSSSVTAPTTPSPAARVPTR